MTPQQRANLLRKAAEDVYRWAATHDQPHNPAAIRATKYMIEAKITEVANEIANERAEFVVKHQPDNPFRDPPAGWRDTPWEKP